MLFPRYINFVRGQVIGLILSWCILPWKILASATVFTAFLSGYGLFMAALVGPSVVEYFYFTRGNVFVSHLYSVSAADSYYWFWRGCNIQAFLAYLAGIALPFPGFVGTLGGSVSVTGVRIGYMGWLISFFVSALVYFILCSIKPTAVQRVITKQGLKWEQLAEEQGSTIDGFCGGLAVNEPQAQEIRSKGRLDTKEVGGSSDGLDVT